MNSTKQPIEDRKSASNDYELLNFIFRWRKAIIIVFVVSVLTSVIVSSSWVIKPRFKSYARIYPINLSSYSEETATEQMLQIFQSDFIRDSIIDLYNLGSCYGLDSGQNYYKSLLIEQYREFVTVEKTEFESVELRVEDYDPVQAYNMVNSLIDVYSEKARRMHRVNEWELVQTFKNELDKKSKEIDNLEEKLTKMREEHGLLDYDAQTKYATKEYVKSVSNNKQAKGLDPLLESLKKEGSKFMLLSNRFKRTMEEFNTLKLQHEEALKQYNRDMNYVSVIEAPYVSDRKSYPVRWIIVVVSVISAETLLLVGASFIEAVKQVMPE